MSVAKHDKVCWKCALLIPAGEFHAADTADDQQGLCESCWKDEVEEPEAASRTGAECDLCKVTVMFEGALRPDQVDEKLIALGWVINHRDKPPAERKPICPRCQN